MIDPRSVHLIVAKHILRYLKGTTDCGLKYDVNQKINLEGYVDSDWASSAIDRKRTSGCCFSTGSCVISWFSRNKSCMVLSTAEAEYVAACLDSCEAVWLRKLLFDLFDLELDATCIYCDNHSCVKWSENPVFHDKSEYIKIKYQYIRDMVERGAMKLSYVATDEQIADVLTKPLAKVKFEYFKEKLGVLRIEIPPKRK